MNPAHAMKRYALEAEVLNLLLSFGCISGESVIVWCDQIIITEKDLDPNLIDLSTMPPAQSANLCSKLAEIADGADKFKALRIALGRMYDAAEKKDPEDLAILAAALGHIPSQHNYNLPDDLRFLYGLDDEFTMAKAGISGTLPETGKAFVKNLKYFKDNFST